MTAVRVTDTTTRTELEALLAEAVHYAKREMPKVGTALLPTPYDEAHEFIDELLHDWQRAPH